MTSPFEFLPGMTFRSLQLRDFRVTLTKRGEGGWWFVEPSGTSAHGSYTAHESHLSRPDLYERVDEGA